MITLKDESRNERREKVKMEKDYDFSGWATKNDIECSDGRTILKDAFKHNDGNKVPLVWNHQHDDPSEVLGHAILENRSDGVYAYCKFNDTESGRTARALVANGDIDKLSIYANKLQTKMNKVIHGVIREVSLVLAGANPGAFIDSVVVHAEGSEDEEEGVIYTEESIEVIDNQSEKESDSDKDKESDSDQKTDSEKDPEPEDKSNSKKEEKTDMDKKEENLKHADEEKTIGEIIDSMTDEQKEAMYAVVGQAVEDATNSEDDENSEKKEGEETMKHNVFDKDTDKKEEVLQHSEFVKSVVTDAKKYGSMKDSFIAHADEYGFDPAAGFTPLFPDAQNVNAEPQMIEKDNSWVANVMSSVKHSPFSRVKSTFGRMTEPEARAKGYIKGTKKTNVKMAFLNRITTPTTVYIKNDIDRDDVVDITDFDVVAWQKKELRKGLDKELALAILFGDGRDISDANKVNEQNIRPIISDNDMFAIKYVVTDGLDYISTKENDSLAKGIVRGAIRARKQYKGSGKPTFYTTEDVLTDLLLIEDLNGRTLYDSVEKLATAMRVKEIVTVPEMEAEAYTNTYGIIVNLNDYTAGADKGGSINMFDDFDIDYNQMKYLMETRMSGALTVPFSAIVLNKTAVAPEIEG